MTVVFGTVLALSMVLLLGVVALGETASKSWHRLAISAGLGLGLAGMAASYAGWSDSAAILAAVAGAGGLMVTTRWIG